jgi:hypothetical protein
VSFINWVALACAVAGLVACSSRNAAPPSSGTAPGARVPTPPSGGARSWADFQRIAAQRMVQASPGQSYMGVPPEPLLAIPVLEVELNGDGSVRRVNVMRRPSQAEDTIQLAVDAVHRAAPYGTVSHLPKPWRFTEVFLFDDQRRFKPRTLD